MTINVPVTCPPPTGTVAGVITSSIGNAIIPNVTVVVTPNGGTALASAKTNSNGYYSVPNVPVANGTGTVALSTLPSTCTAPSPTSYSGLTSGRAIAVNVIVTCAATTGSLTVTVVAQPGVPASVHVAGPSGYSQTVTATQTLSGLAPGSYTLSASGGTLTDAIVSTTYTVAVSGSPATVVAGQTATATVTYNSGGTGGLWIANSVGFTISELTAGQLHASGSPTPAVTVIPHQLPTGAPQGLAVDGNGNLWVASGNATVVEFTRAQITAGDTLAPATSVLIEPSDPFGLAFDASGNLWVADHGSTFIYELTPSQLVTTGIPVTPAVTILYPGAAQFSKLAFDPTGNLWAVTHDSLLVAFTPAQLASGGTITPSVVIHSNAGSLDHPYDVAFDASGDAWVVNIADSTIVEYTPSQLAASGSPAPATTIAIRDVGTISSAPSALAFDNSGDLWVADLNRNEVMEFTPSQLAAGGAQVPAARLTGSAFNGATGLTFDPHSPSLPLH
ncbi:MAG TPA: hypothetical protein VNV25_02625 [Gemmatimonadaceae bacterium]|nr:hypothetical protein [Gemmatimonadaceae bacterium]